MPSSPKGVFYSMMVAQLCLKIPFRHHYYPWVQFIQISISRAVHNTHTHTSMMWSILGRGLTPIQIVNSLSFCGETRAEWVRRHYFWLAAYPGFFSPNFYNWSCCLWLKILLGLLTMQEETNPLWLDHCLPHFGTAANTCTEVPHDHQVVRW